MQTLCVFVLCLAVLGSHAAQPKGKLPEHDATRVGLELETKAINYDQENASDAPIYLIGLKWKQGTKETDLDTPKLQYLKNKELGVWMVPEDDRDISTDRYKTSAVGALTGEIDQFSPPDSISCGMLEFVFRPTQKIKNGDSVEEMLVVSRAWEKAMIGACADGPQIVPLTIDCGANTIAKGDKNRFAPVTHATDAFNAKMTQLGGGYTQYKVKIRRAEEVRANYYFMCPTGKVTKGTKKVDVGANEAAEKIRRAFGAQPLALKATTTVFDVPNLEYPSLDIYQHVNMYVAVATLVDGRYDELIPEDSIASNLKACRAFATTHTTTNNFPKYAPAFTLLCWMAVTQESGGASGGGASKDKYLAMPKISLAAMLRLVEDDTESAALFRWAQTQSSGQSPWLAFAQSTYTAVSGQLTNGRTQQDFATTFVAKATPGFNPSQEETTARAYAFGKVDKSEASSPYADYGAVSINGVPCFIAEMRYPPKHRLLQYVLPGLFIKNVKVTAQQLAEFWQSFVTAGSTFGVLDKGEGGCSVHRACGLIHGKTMDEFQAISTGECELCIKQLKKVVTQTSFVGKKLDRAKCTTEGMSAYNGGNKDLRTLCAYNALGAEVIADKDRDKKDTHKLVNEVIQRNAKFKSRRVRHH